MRKRSSDIYEQKLSVYFTYKQVLVDSLNEKDNQANLRWVSPKIAQIAFMKVKSEYVFIPRIHSAYDVHTVVHHYFVLTISRHYQTLCCLIKNVKTI